MVLLIRAPLAAFALTLMAAPALAQNSGYDANCSPKDYTADELLQQEICQAHVGCRFTMKASTSACKVKDFLSNLGGLLGGRSSPDNVDVILALNTSEVPQTAGVKQINATARPYYQSARPLPSYDRSNAAQIDWKAANSDTPVRNSSLRRETGGGSIWVEEQDAWVGKPISGATTLITSSGVAVAGNIENGNGSGPGLLRGPNGSWSGGNMTPNGLQGQGYSLTPNGPGATPVMEGTFLNGQADGMMLVTYPDFSSRKELWKNGKLLATGEKVPRGVAPKDPDYKSPEQIAAEKAAAEAAAFAAQLASEKNPGALYALGDEWAEKGDMAKAKSAWRELIKRFPDSPLAIKATDRLSGGGTPSTSRSSAPAEAVTGTTQSAACTGSPAEALDTYNREFFEFQNAYPMNPNWGTRDTYKYSLFAGEKGLQILERLKACLSPQDYAANQTALSGVVTAGRDGCRATSNDGGAGCVAEYP
jgi:hypothetical protein